MRVFEEWERWRSRWVDGSLAPRVFVPHSRRIGESTDGKARAWRRKRAAGRAAGHGFLGRNKRTLWRLTPPMLAFMLSVFIVCIVFTAAIRNKSCLAGLEEAGVFGLGARVEEESW